LDILEKGILVSASALKKSPLLLAFLAALIAARFQIEHQYRLPFPHFNALLTKTSGMQDAAFITLGFRALAADVAWVELLQNMGDYGNAEESGKKFPYLKNDTLRVTRIDPYFKRAYLFGAATLAWLQSTNRPDEAMDILEEGVRYNPEYWPLRTYAAGIGYMKTNQMDAMIHVLEDALRDPEVPMVVKSVLANSYKVKGRYEDAIAIWEDVLSDPKGIEYYDRAHEEIPKLRQLQRSKSKNPSVGPPNRPKPR
jgi:tetratricopeptide (TPR) repeat protein